MALAMQLPEELQDLPAGDRIQVARRLVCQEDARPSHQGAGDRHALLLPTRELAGTVTLPVGQADPLHGLLGQGLALLLPHTGVRQGQLDITQRCYAGK
jgi:hypothetical protein